MTPEEVQRLADPFGFNWVSGPTPFEMRSNLWGTLLEVKDRYEPTRTARLQYACNDGYGDTFDTFLNLLQSGRELQRVDYWFPLDIDRQTAEVWTEMFKNLRENPDVQRVYQRHQVGERNALHTVDESLLDKLPGLHLELEALLVRYRVKLRPSLTKQGFLFVEETQ